LTTDTQRALDPKASTLLSWRIGDVTITRVPEHEWAMEAEHFLPAATPEALADYPWLYPDFVTENGRLRISFHALLVEAPGLRLVVDTCHGENKTIGYLSLLERQGYFLDGLAAAGFDRDNVHFVLCTHLHVDHVGWNTMLVDEAWVPTFPNSRYLIGATEYAHWTSGKKHHEVFDIDTIMRESISPVFNAGLVDLVASDHRISPELSLVPTPGHTAGHVSLRIESQGRRGFITGDMLPHPCQISRPDWVLPFDEDPARVVEDRQRLLDQWVADDTLVIGSHFPAPTAGRIVHVDGCRRLVR
jgi:glyoxylase-like metal-dependent hydrolase (beta-lactamase superfamily II)